MIYLDNAATTKPCLECVRKAMKFNSELFFNPSALYQGGLNCAREIKQAKELILKCLGAVSFDVTFTSCGTESDNLAIFGIIKRGTFVTDKGEHSAVHKSFVELKNNGQTVEFIDIKQNGQVDEQKLFDFVRNNRVDFLSIMHVNNETGAINDVNYIAKTVKTINPKIIFHVDGVQAFGKLKYRISNDIDLYSISAHKINGLKGVGALIRKKNLTISPRMIGGGQENGLRSGTENVFGIKVFEYATYEHYKNLDENYTYIRNLKTCLLANLDKSLITVISDDNSSPYILTISASGIKSEVLMHTLETEGVIVGNGSACSSRNKYSRVIEACGYSANVLEGVIRISFSLENTLDEMLFVADLLNKSIKKLKGIMKK